MSDPQVSNWYHCPKCNEPVDPILDEKGDLDEYHLTLKSLVCPDCGTEVVVRHE